MILVTGGAGYIGSHFVLACLDNRRSVVVLDDLSTGFRDAVPPDVPFVHGDFGDKAILDRITRAYDISAIVHFAGRVIVEESITDPLQYYDINTARTRTLLAHCVLHEINEVVFSSTAAVYGPPLQRCVPETAPTRPISPYGRSKLMVEWMLDDLSHASDLRFVALRYFNVAGADPAGRAGLRTLNATHLLKRICEVAAGHLPHLDVYGRDYDTPDGTCIRDFIHVSDLASAHLHALDYLSFGNASTVLNCGYGTGISVRDAIGTMSDLLGHELPHQYCARRPGDIPAIIADVGLLHATLDWVPQFNALEPLLRTALAYEMQISRRRLGAA